MKIINPKISPYQLQLIIVSNSLPEKTPEYQVYINGRYYEPKTVINIDEFKEKHSYDYPLTKIKTIEVSLLNKTINDTIVDGDTIISDLYIKIEKLIIDNFDITPHLNQISNYKNNKGFKNTNGYLGANGTMTIKIHHNLFYTDIICSLLK